MKFCKLTELPYQNLYFQTQTRIKFIINMRPILRLQYFFQYLYICCSSVELLNNSDLEFQVSAVGGVPAIRHRQNKNGAFYLCGAMTRASCHSNARTAFVELKTKPKLFHKKARLVSLMVFSRFYDPAGLHKRFY